LKVKRKTFSDNIYLLICENNNGQLIIFNFLYQKVEIQKIISKPPETSIIRVNTNKISTKEAMEVPAIKVHDLH